MAALLLQVGSLDLTQYVRAQPDEGLAPDGGGTFLEPQFGGSLALSEGQVAVGESVSNREFGAPLWLGGRPSELTNYVSNPSLEENATGYSDSGGGQTSPSRSTSQAQYGDASLAVAKAGGGPYTDPYSQFQITGATVTALRGQQVTFSVWARPDSVSKHADSPDRAILYSDGGAAVSAPLTNLVAGVWQRVSVTTTVASAATTITLRLYNAQASGTAYYDGIMLTTGGRADYFDGDSLDADWTGSAHASTSTCYAGTDGALKMLSKLRRLAVAGATVKFRPDGSDNISFLDLEAADVRPQYNHHALKHGWLKVNVVLRCRPYAHTGTTRLVASAAGSGPLQLVASGIIGDVPALANVQIRAGDEAGVRRVYAYGIKYPVPSGFDAVRRASAFSLVGGALLPGTRMVGSSFIGKNVAVGVTSDQFALEYLPAETFEGAYRVLGIVAHRYSVATGLKLSAYYARGLVGAATLAAVQPTGNAGAWQVVDFGELRVASGIPSQYISLSANTANAGSIVASPGLRLNALIYVPLEHAAGFAVSPTGPSEGGLNRGYTAFESTPEPALLRRTPSLVAYHDAADYRGNPPRVPPVGSPAASGPANVLVLQGLVDNFRGDDATEASVTCRERWTFYRT